MEFSGGRKLSTVWDFCKNYDIVIILQTWIEREKEAEFKCKLDANLNWSFKSAVRTNKKGRVKGGQIIGIRNNICEKINVNEWEFEFRISGDLWANR